MISLIGNAFVSAIFFDSGDGLFMVRWSGSVLWFPHVEHVIFVKSFTMMSGIRDTALVKGLNKI